MPSPKPKPRSKNDLYRPLSEELAYLEESHTFDGNEHLYSTGPAAAQPQLDPTPGIGTTPLVIPTLYPIPTPTPISTPLEATTPPVTSIDTPESTPLVNTTGGVTSNPQEELPPLVDYIYWDRFAIRKAKLVQDGLTRAQFALYDHLWRKGQGTTETDCVDAPAGWGRLAKELRMSDKTIKLNMLQLVSKLVVELAKEEDRYLNTPRVYRVWSMRKILDRWAAAGMVYVKANSGVQFLTPEEVRNYASQGRLPRERPTRMMPAKASNPRRPGVVDTSTGPGEKTSRGPGVVFSTGPGVISSTPPIENTFLEHKTQSPSSSVADRTVVAAELGKHIGLLGTTDDAYVDRLITQCRRRSPDAPARMVAWVISTKIRKAAKDNIQDAAAYLATSVEGMFSGVSYDIAKQEWERSERQQQEADERQHHAQRSAAREFVRTVHKYPEDATTEQREQAAAYMRDYGFLNED